jgi:hypothetical protein
MLKNNMNSKNTRCHKRAHEKRIYPEVRAHHKCIPTSSLLRNPQRASAHDLILFSLITKTGGEVLCMMLKERRLQTSQSNPHEIDASMGDV